jgi:large subunit ribosomal protein L5
MAKPRMKERYLTQVRPELSKQFGYTSPMQAPRPYKVCINMGVRGGNDDPKVLDAAVQELAVICGQRPCVTRAKKSIANFKIRAGMPIGCRVTLRGDRMYEFLDRLFSVALPRIRDFRGLSPNAFDGRGNYTLGVTEQLIFPELGYDDVQSVRGMHITICTTAQTDEEAAALLRHLGLPLAAA